MPTPSEPWPHAPPHHFTPLGTYIVTAGALHRQPLFNSPEKLDLFRATAFEFFHLWNLRLQAWAFFVNHYHVVASFEDAVSKVTLSGLLRDLHYELARRLNALDHTPGRHVMYQHWETELTYEKSWLARLNYVHHNPVKHGLVPMAGDYPWCSARWFESNASPEFVKTVGSFKTDRIKVPDDFDCLRRRRGGPQKKARA